MGLVENEWFETIATMKQDDIIYESYVEIGNKIANELRDDLVDDEKFKRKKIFIKFNFFKRNVT